MELSKNEVKYIKSLQNSKFRQKYEKFVAEGDKVVRHLLQSRRIKVMYLVATEPWLAQYGAEYKSFASSIYEVAPHKMEQITGLKSAPDVILVADQWWHNVTDAPLDQGYFFYLDGIQDPGNAGTILRIADWFGIKGVIVSEDSVDLFSPKAVQSSMASLIHIPIYEMSRTQFIQQIMPKHHIIIMDMNGKNIESTALPPSGIVVLGSEGQGVNKSIIEALQPQHQVVSIQGAAYKSAESLNVGVSAGIIAQKIFNLTFKS
jgi:RNA methyltransferase, TrmH family